MPGTVTGRSRVEIRLPAGFEQLRLRSLDVVERISQIGEMALDLGGPGPLEARAPALETLLGKPIGLSIVLEDGSTKRHWHGIVCGVTQEATGKEWLYRARVVPSVWLLTRHANCRVFQNATVPQIVKTVLDDRGITFASRCRGTYRTREYCVQYRETDFNFIARLLEDEGIAFWFEHASDSHTLVLGDDPSSHTAGVGGANVPFRDALDVAIEADHLATWTRSRAIVPATYALGDWDFVARTKVSGEKTVTLTSYTDPGAAVYDYPGGIQPASEGTARTAQAKLRLEEQQAAFARVRGSGNHRALYAGATLTLDDDPYAGLDSGVGDTDSEYLVVESRYRITGEVDRSGGGEDECEVEVEAIPACVAYRPPRTTPKPVVPGPQTALVVGPEEEEIHVDAHGRVRAQFHWDRLGTLNENSTCWMRVAQPWAGNKRGFQWLPRIGDEVVVEFLEGDPDRPLITGSVYNGEHPPPWTLPADKNKVGLRTRTTKGGAEVDCGEFVFDDTKDAEKFLLRTTRRGGGDPDCISFLLDATKDAQKFTLKTPTKDQGEAIGANQLIFDATNDAQKIDLHASRDLIVNVEKDETRKVNKNRASEVVENDTEKVGQDQKIEVGKTYVLEVADEITIKTGESSINMKKDGTITITGKDFKFEATAAVEVKAGSEMKLEATAGYKLKSAQVEVTADAKIKMSASGQFEISGAQTKIAATAMLDLSGSAMAKLAGGMVMIG